MIRWLRASPALFRLVLLKHERALAQPEPLFRPLLKGGFEYCTGQPEIIGIDQNMADFAARPHST